MVQPARPKIVVSWVETSDHKVNLSEEEFAELVDVDVAVIRALVDGRKLEVLLDYDLEDRLGALDDDGFEGLSRDSVDVVLESPKQLVRRRKGDRDGKG